MKSKKIWIVSSLIILVLICLITLQPGKQDRYYKNKLNQPPCQVIVKAFNLFERPGKALDIGFGAGNETVLMINSDWQVWALYKEPKAIQIINQRTDIKNPINLVATVANFEENLTWGMLPQVDFINASYTLPFCDPCQATSESNPATNGEPFRTDEAKIEYFPFLTRAIS